MRQTSLHKKLLISIKNNKRHCKINLQVGSKYINCMKIYLGEIKNSFLSWNNLGNETKI